MLKYDLQGILKYLADYWSDGYATIIMNIALISMAIFHYGNDSATLELTGNMSM